MLPRRGGDVALEGAAAAVGANLGADLERAEDGLERLLDAAAAFASAARQLRGCAAARPLHAKAAEAPAYHEAATRQQRQREDPTHHAARDRTAIAATAAAAGDV